MDQSVLVPSNNGNRNQGNNNQTCTKQPTVTTRQKETTPIAQESDPNSSTTTVEIVISNDISQAALRPSTILKCRTYQTKWNNYCMKNNISHIKPELLEYFTHLYNSGASYSVLSSSKSAFSHIVFLPPYLSILEHPQIIKCFKRVYHLRPPTQIIMFFWDVKILLDYFSHKGESGQLSDKSLTQKFLRPKNDHCTFFYSRRNDSYRYRGYIFT